MSKKEDLEAFDRMTDEEKEKFIGRKFISNKGDFTITDDDEISENDGLDDKDII